MVREYTMAGRVRPLLFWFGRENVGFARVVWRRGDRDRRGYELLVGSDPSKAPWSLNRWGFIAEERIEGDGSLLALMTAGDEASYDEAASRSRKSSSPGDFSAIRGNMDGGLLRWQVARLTTATPLTIHEVSTALDRVARATTTAPLRQRNVASVVRPGFLSALAELIDRVVLGSAPGHGRPTITPVQYAFGQHTYDLMVREAASTNTVVDGESVPSVRLSFEIRRLDGDSRTRFEMTCGREGALAGVPLTIEWQPRWWLKVALRLNRQSVSPVAARNPLNLEFSSTAA
jgi:hypothetical protein